MLGRVTHPADDLADAIEIARSLLHTMEMPQQPDAMTISDAAGTELYRCAIDHRAAEGSLAANYRFIPKEGDRDD